MTRPESIYLLCEPISELQAPLFPEEALLIERAVTKRRQEFTAGRTLARRALQLAQLTAGPILQDERAPRWPPSATGSISHCSTHCAAAAAARSKIRSIGLDLETIGLVNQDLWSHIFTAAERRTLQSLSHEDQLFQSTACFSAKEAFYKLQHPLTRQWVNFEEVSVTIDHPGQFTLTCHTELPGLPRVITGAILQPDPTLILCLLWLPAQ